MSAYIIADILLHEPDRYKEYVENVPALIKKHGGKYCVRGGDAQVLEGSWSPSRLIILEFPDRAAALAMYDDPEYEPYKSLRGAISDSKVVIVNGFAD